VRSVIMRIAACSIGLLLSLAAADAAAQTPPARVSAETLEGARRAAREALSTFAQLVTPRNARDMGFEKPDEVRSATVGALLPEFQIRLDELQGYTAGTNPGGLLHESGLFLVPVLVGEQVRSSLTIQHERGAFKAVAFGAPGFILLASHVIGGIAGAAERKEAFLVRIPALNVFFVAYPDGDKLLFASVLDDPRFDLKSGEPLPAEKVLERLIPAAREHKGLPS
jgi:hypothetical protein